MRAASVAKRATVRKIGIVVPVIAIVASALILKAAEPEKQPNPFDHVNLSNASSLYEMCSMSGMDDVVSKALATTACTGYLSGLNDGLILAFFVSKKSAPYCMPDEGITNELLRAVYVKDYLKHEGEQKPNDTSRMNVFRMLMEEFPCTAAKP